MMPELPPAHRVPTPWTPPQVGLPRGFPRSQGQKRGEGAKYRRGDSAALCATTAASLRGKPSAQAQHRRPRLRL